MKVERACSVCSDDAPSSPDSVMSTGEASPQPPSPAPHTESYDDQRLYSPAYTAHSPAYSTSSASSNPSTGSGGGASPGYESPASPGSPEYQRPASPDFGFGYVGDGGFAGVEKFGCQADFTRAVLDGDLRELKSILTRYSALVQINGFTADGQTALTQSCIDGNLEVIKVLVAHGASLHLANRDGFSPLHLACWRGKYDVMEYLLRLRAAAR